jgi:hypothetical protein
MRRLIEKASNWFHNPLFNKETLQEIEKQGIKFELDTLESTYVRFLLYYGSKYLRVNIDDRSQKICTYVRGNKIKDKELNETTIIYKAAYNLMQKYVNQKNKPFVYEFSTSWPKMQKWAMDPKKGKGIFNWEDSKETKEHKLFCTITITPPQQEINY